MAGVEVQNLSFSYSRRGRNLENINMVVPRGTIYGLLGPSGCCKTTLLRCIVGRLKARHGSVLVFGYKPGTRECGIPGPNIGYMPQELSLISQFTVRETLEYYAGFAQTPDHKGVYHKDKCHQTQDLNSRIEFLLKLLDISDFEHIFTDRLSGGQKRRVSLAVAMINDPPLLILDEPTVGVDPIVRDAIWSYLLEQSKNGLTIIVTTHYIEEAAQAHNVGFMRQGRILAEGNPGQLMRQYNVPTLESLFLRLSRHDDVTRTTPENELLCSIALENAAHAHDPHFNHAHGPNSTALHHRTNTLTMAETQFNGTIVVQSDTSVATYSNGTTITAKNAFLNAPPNVPPIDYEEYNNNNNNNNPITVIDNQHHHPDVITTSTEGNINNNHSINSNYSNNILANGSAKSVKSSASHLNQELTNGSVVVPSNKSDTLRSNKGRAGRTYSIHSSSHRVSAWEKVGVLCRKHRLRLFRRVPELVITMLLPALEVALFCLCMGRDPTAIQMAVCNQEKPPFMSLVFLKSIDPDFIQLKYYNTPEEAIDSVRNADTYSAIVLAKNFTASMHQFASKVFPDQMSTQAMGESATTLARLLQQKVTMPNAAPSTGMPHLTSLGPTGGVMEKPPAFELFSSPTSTPLPSLSSTTANPLSTLAPVTAIPIESLTDPEALHRVDDSIIKIYYDGSNALHVNIIRRELFSAVFRFIDQLGKVVGHSGIANMLPIKFEKPIYGTEKTDMIEFVGPGLMVFIVFFATMSITSMAFLSERREGTLERSLIVGMTPTEFIISQIINITFLLIVQITLTVVMGFWIFSFPMKGSYILAVAMMFCQGLCGMTYGLMLSAICTNEMTALMLGAGSQLMFCFITGIFWPVDTMIPLLRYFSYMMPQTLPMESFRHILIRGFDLSRPAVWNGYLISMGWVVFFLILAIVIFRLR